MCRRQKSNLLSLDGDGLQPSRESAGAGGIRDDCPQVGPGLGKLR
jgi:hypothetical protein